MIEYKRYFSVRLAFSKENEHNIRLGVEKLARVFKSQLE
jgi:hypothetical protein